MSGGAGAKMPNEPKMPASIGSKNLGDFAEDAKLKAPEQFETVSKAIEPEHVFGQKAQMPGASPMHLGPRNFGASKVGGFGNKEKVRLPNETLEVTKTPKSKI